MRVLLDSNVWRYIVDADALLSIQRAVRQSPHAIVVAPAVVYEALATRDAALRSALVSAMTLPQWSRLMPEAYGEAQEIKAEIRRLRPEWLRQAPDLKQFRRQRRDWERLSGGFWTRARLDTDAEARRVATNSLIELARQGATTAREESKGFDPRWQTARLDGVMEGEQHAADGGKVSAVEQWRMQGLRSFSFAMSQDDHPYSDWMEGEVDLELMTFQSKILEDFWKYQVDTIRMPRHWLRWACSFLQRFHRVTDGTPGDAQLAAYLIDVDLMLSGDGNLIRIAERCRAEAPFFVCRSTKVPGGPAAVDAVLSVLRS